ncbi:28160_t:CDS:2 [Gigaspora margarita]|uniref:28160_t:CDS:1 n=1 Tax=Gigaspora margarita TaxID=4874 RepID=A0ABM8VW25_GIGMA|nr:28160_t:CDS:2 [Gigaspora margarita]
MLFRLFDMTKKKKQDRLSEEDEVYAAMCILAEKHDEQNSVMYLVKWAGHDQNGNEWEPTWMDNVEKIDDVCQSRQINGINGKKKKLHHLYDTPNTTNNIMSIGRSLFWDDGNQNNDVTSESSRSSSSKRTIFRKDSTKDADLDDNHKRSVSLKSRQVKIFKSFSSKGKLSVNSFRRVPNGNISSSDSEQEIHHHMNGNGAIQFYKYPLRSRSGRISITRRLECSSISKRKVSPRSFDGRISDDLVDSRKKLRYDEDSYSSEEEILCSGQAIPCSPITPIITHSPKNDTDIDDLYAPPIPKTTNIKKTDKSVSISTPKSTISPTTNANMNGSHELAQKSLKDLGITSANDANPSSKRPTDLHHSIQNIKTSIPTPISHYVNINVNTQPPDSLLSNAPKPGQTVRTDANLKSTQKRTQAKARKLSLKPDAGKNSSQVTVSSPNPPIINLPILPKPPNNILPMIRPTTLMNNNTNMRPVQNRSIRPNRDLYPILPDDNHNKVTLKDGQGSAVIADHGQQSRNMLHAPPIAHKSQTSPLGVGLNSLQLENSVTTTNTINCNTINCNIASNFRGKTNIQSFQDIHNATDRYMKSELIEQRKAIERQKDQLSKAHKALAEKSEECESLKYILNNMITDESLKRDNESLKQENESLKRENEKLKMYWAKFIQSGVSFNPRDYSRLSDLYASIQTLINQNHIVVSQSPRTQNTSSISSPDILRSKLNQSQLKVSLLERTLQMKDECEKACQQTTKLVLDLKLEPLRNYVELQNNVRALIPSSMLEAARMNTDHTTSRGDTSINISISRNCNDTLSSNIITSNNINAQTDNSSFNTSNNSNSVRGMDVVGTVNSISKDKGIMKTKDNIDANVIKSTNGIVTKSKEVIPIPIVSTLVDEAKIMPISDVVAGSSKSPEFTLTPSTSIASISKSLVTPTKSTPKTNGGSSTRFTAITNSRSAVSLSSNTSNKATNGMLNASAKSQYSVPAIHYKDIPNVSKREADNEPTLFNVSLNNNPTTTKILESSVTTDKKGKSIFGPASRKIVASTSNGMPNIANIGHRKSNKYAQEELFCHWNWCNKAFKTKPELRMHVLSLHFQEHEKDLKPYVRTLD